MKNLICFIAAVVISFSISCKDDDEIPQNIDIEGNWKVEKIIINGDATYNGLTYPITEERNNSCTKESYMNLNTDASGEMLIKDDTSGTCDMMEQQDFTFSYDENAKVITFVSSGYSETGNVESLSPNALTLKRSVNNYDLNGIIFTGTITAHFTR